jgi:peptide/nickel transport system permease protein
VTAAPSPVARLGLVLPGLGHVLRGDAIAGVGLLLLDGWLAWAAIAGLPRLGAVTGLTTGQPSLHGLVAVAGWVALAAVAWRAAWRLAVPAPEVDEPSEAAIVLRQLGRHRTGMLGVVGVVQLLALTLLAPLIAPFDPDAVGVGAPLIAPTAAHLLGTDTFGRDLFSRVLYGARVSVTIGFVAVGLAATLGTTLGAVAGYFSGVVDRAVSWVVDLLLSVPRLVLLLAVVGLFRPPGVAAIFLIVVVLGLTGWMGVSRIVRSQVLSLKEQDFVAACRALGLGHGRILFRHLVPNALAPVIVYCTLALGGTMLAEASLSFLGLGVQPPTSTWGTMVADGRHQLLDAPWVAGFPGLAIVLAVMSFNLLGDGLRDALDPKQREP